MYTSIDNSNNLFSNNDFEKTDKIAAKQLHNSTNFKSLSFWNKAHLSGFSRGGYTNRKYNTFESVDSIRLKVGQ